MAARQGGANDHRLIDGRQKRGTCTGLQVEADLLICSRLVLETDDVTDGRAGVVEAVPTEGWDDVLWDLPYKEVMENIAKCKTYFSTWDKAVK